jgi:hypothetical protein
MKRTLSRYFRKFLVTTPSAEMAVGCIDTLSIQIFLISRFKFSHVVIFSALDLVKVMGSRELLYLLQVLFFISIHKHHIRSFEGCDFIGYDRHAPIYNQDVPVPSMCAVHNMAVFCRSYMKLNVNKTRPISCCSKHKMA